jgi:hypothetical protein
VTRRVALVPTLVMSAWVLWSSGSGALTVAPAPVDLLIVDLVRIGGLVAAAYLAVLVALALAGSVARWPRRLLTRLPFGRLVATAAGLSLVIASPVAAGMSTGPAVAPPPATLVLADAEIPPAPASMVLVADDAIPEPATMTVLDTAADAAPAASVGIEPPVYTVVAGDHMWSIAHRWFELLTGDEPTDADVATVWRQLLAANADRLSDPDRLVPGDQILLAFPDLTAA